MNKMSHQKIEELYYNYNLVINGTPIWCNVFIVHMDIVNDIWLFGKLHYYRSGVKFISLNHYGTLKVK
jgi:hypothetical protein